MSALLHAATGTHSARLRTSLAILLAMHPFTGFAEDAGPPPSQAMPPLALASCPPLESGQYPLPESLLSESPELRALFPSHGRALSEAFRFEGGSRIPARSRRGGPRAVRHTVSIWHRSDAPRAEAQALIEKLMRADFKDLHQGQTTDAARGFANLLRASDQASVNVTALEKQREVWLHLSVNGRTPSVPDTQRAWRDGAAAAFPPPLLNLLEPGLHEASFDCVSGERRAQVTSLLSHSTWRAVQQWAKRHGFRPVLKEKERFYVRGDPLRGGLTVYGVDGAGPHEDMVDMVVALGPNAYYNSPTELADHNRALRERASKP